MTARDRYAADTHRLAPRRLARGALILLTIGAFVAAGLSGAMAKHGDDDWPDAIFGSGGSGGSGIWDDDVASGGSGVWINAGSGGSGGWDDDFFDDDWFDD